MTSAAGGRRRSAAIRSIDDWSAQCRSSSTTTSGAAASAASSDRIAACRRWRSTPSRRRARARGRTLDSAASSGRLSARPGWPATCASSASTHGANGRSVSYSAARPASTRPPRARARSVSSASRRLLPMPGSPVTTSAGEPPAPQIPEDLVQAGELSRASEERGRHRPILRPCIGGHPDVSRAAGAEDLAHDGSQRDSAPRRLARTPVPLRHRLPPRGVLGRAVVGRGDHASSSR